MEDISYSIVLNNPATGESSILCYGTTLDEGSEVVAQLSAVHPDLQFRLVMTDPAKGCLVMRAG